MEDDPDAFATLEGYYQKGFLKKVLSDAVHCLLTAMSTGQDVTMLVADVTDAFWLVPLHINERKNFVAK